jgi:hypothetical protein
MEKPRVYLYVGILVALVLVFSGCMEALHIQDAAGITPSPSASLVGLVETPGVTNNASDPELIPESTETVLAQPEDQSGEQLTAPALITQEMSPSPVDVTAVPESTVTSTVVSTATPTPLPTATPTPLPPSPTPTPAITIVAPTLPSIQQNYMERWRSIQQGRQVFSNPRVYTTSRSDLWWYDPVNQQHVVLGTLSGNFEAQAIFTLEKDGSEMKALEVPYQVNQSYGLTSISSALLQRIDEAGYNEWIEAYVIVTDNVQRHQE